MCYVYIRIDCVSLYLLSNDDEMIEDFVWYLSMYNINSRSCRTRIVATKSAIFLRPLQDYLVANHAPMIKLKS